MKDLVKVFAKIKSMSEKSLKIPSRFLVRIFEDPWKISMRKSNCKECIYTILLRIRNDINEIAKLCCL